MRRNCCLCLDALVVATASPGVLSIATGPVGGATVTTSDRRPEAAMLDIIPTGLVHRATVAPFATANTDPGTSMATPSSSGIRQVVEVIRAFSVRGHHDENMRLQGGLS